MREQRHNAIEGFFDKQDHRDSAQKQPTKLFESDESDTSDELDASDTPERHDASDGSDAPDRSDTPDRSDGVYDSDDYSSPHYTDIDLEKLFAISSDTELPQAKQTDESTASESKDHAESTPEPWGTTCPNCGEIVAPGDWFCLSCGTIVAAHKSSTKRAQVSPKAKHQALPKTHNNTGINPGVSTGSSSKHYEPEPEPSPLPKILMASGAVMLALGLGYIFGVGKTPWAHRNTTTPTQGSAAAGSAGSASNAADGPGSTGTSTTASEPGGGQSSSGSTSSTQTVTYTLVPEALSWEDAQAYCEERGGTLAQPRTQEELDEVLALLEDSNLWAVYVGAHRTDASSEEFVWLDGAPVDRSLFAKGEPNNIDGIEDCVAAFDLGTSCGLYDVPSDLRADYPVIYIGFVMETRSS